MLEKGQDLAVDISLKTETCVTVVLCCYSHERYFIQAIQSILTQTVKVKCVILNNGSGQSYTELINRTARMHDLDVISVEKNTYGLSLREKVLPFINSEFVAILHDDDVYFPRKIEMSLPALKAGSADYVVTNVIFINELGTAWLGQSDAINTSPLREGEPRGALIADMVRPPGCRMHFSTLVMRTDLVQSNLLGDPFWPRIADAFFWVDQLLDETVRLKIVPEPLSKVRIHGRNDRLYTKYNKVDRVKQEFLLSMSEMSLIFRVLERGGDKIIISFLNSYTGVEMKGDLSESLVLTAVIMGQREYSHWFSRQYMTCLFFHRAFEIDGLRACAQVEKLTGQDANIFMQENYDRFVTAMLKSAATANGVSFVSLPAIAHIDLLEEYRSKRATLSWVWRHPRKAFARGFYALARWGAGKHERSE